MSVADQQAQSLGWTRMVVRDPVQVYPTVESVRYPWEPQVPTTVATTLQPGTVVWLSPQSFNCFVGRTCRALLSEAVSAYSSNGTLRQLAVLIYSEDVSRLALAVVGEGLDFSNQPPPPEPTVQRFQPLGQSTMLRQPSSLLSPLNRWRR